MQRITSYYVYERHATTNWAALSTSEAAPGTKKDEALLLQQNLIVRVRPRMESETGTT